MFMLKKLVKTITGLAVDQRGATLVLVALFLVVLMGFAAFCVDAGMLYKTRREMVTSADAASLAGAKAYVEALKAGKAENEAKTDAETEASNCAISNKAQGSLVTPEVKTITYDGASRKVIEVNVGHNKEYAFAKVLGFTNKDVMAGAVATWGYVKEVTGGSILPLFCTDSSYALGTTVPLHYGKLIINEGDVSTGGNWGYFKIGIGDAWKDALKGDLSDCDLSINDPEEGMTGNKQSLIGCIEERMDRCAQEKVTMYGLVPIIDESGIKKETGKLVLPILYFAVFLIEDVITDNSGNGSTHADFDYGAGTPINYGSSYEMGTIIGHFTGETVDVSVVIQPGDQDNPNDPNNPPTTYVKLID
jgi:Flp pilus assembly protein TadG